MGDWTGTGNIGPLDRKYRSFELAREFAHSLGLKSKTEWGKYRKSGRLPKDIPGEPRLVYKGLTISLVVLPKPTRANGNGGQIGLAMKRIGT